MRIRVLILLTIAATVLGDAFALSTWYGDQFDFSDGKIIKVKTGEIADDLRNYDAICLVGKSSILSESVFECAGIAGSCPPIGSEGGILLARDGRCNFFAIANARVLFEYEYACSASERRLSIFHPNDVPILGFADDGPKADRVWSDNCKDPKKAQTRKNLTGEASL
jgi:hypothetical protein